MDNYYLYYAYKNYIKNHGPKQGAVEVSHPKRALVTKESVNIADSDTCWRHIIRTKTFLTTRGMTFVMIKKKTEGGLY